MSEQRIDTEYDSDRRTLGDLVVGIRVDTLPGGEADRLAEDGSFYPLTLDASGRVRVALSSDTKIETAELQVLREIRDLLEQQLNLLRQIAPRG